MCQAGLIVKYCHAFARVVRSAWEGRCWTLQEGLLAENLILQTADTAFHNTDTWNKVQFDELYGWSDYGDLIWNIVNATHRDPVGRLETQGSDLNRNLKTSTRDLQLIDVWNSLLGRSTTKLEDVHCIVANLLDFSATEILKFPFEKRMKAMLSGQDPLPVELICSESPRVQSDEDLNRWVPTYPGGSQIHAYNLNMRFAKVQAGRELRINLVASDLMIWVEGGIPRSPKSCLEDTNSEEKWWIHLHTSEDVSMVSNSLHYPKCLFINKPTMSEDTVQGHGYCGLRAMLSLARLDDNGIRAVFDSSFSFGLWSWVQTHTDFDNLPVVASTLLPSKHHILIESGNFKALI